MLQLVSGLRVEDFASLNHHLLDELQRATRVMKRAVDVTPVCPTRKRICVQTSPGKMADLGPQWTAFQHLTQWPWLRFLSFPQLFYEEELFARNFFTLMC